jgi:hypothetical protein
MKDLHADRLMEELQKLVTAMGVRAATSLVGKVEGVSGRLTDYSEKGGAGLLSAVTGNGGSGGGLRKNKKPAFNALKSFAKTKLQQTFQKGGGGGGDGKGQKLKVTNIVETMDVGVPLDLAYNQWTQFKDFPSFMKKVESVEQEADEKLSWKAQILWSHRTWESNILEQIPDRRIVWRSKGAKGYVDGAVTFHELAPELTRITLILEYHPQGFFEHTGNLWRAQGRRARLEFKHFCRHMTSQAVLHPDEIEGWRGEIRDGEVVKEHEAARPEEEEEAAPEEEDEYAEEEEEAEEPEEEEQQAPEEEPPAEDEYEEEAEYDEAEEEEEEPEEERPRRRQRQKGRA